MRVIGLIRLRLGLLEGPCECGIGPRGSISHGVSFKTEAKRSSAILHFTYLGTYSDCHYVMPIFASKMPETQFVRCLV